ncbi:hypothetical protein ASC96_29900 [Rhizobium sp. Root1204]|nr:hypothetical protein ASC96_29900 [Rhizobium sp. Root1204]
MNDERKQPSVVVTIFHFGSDALLGKGIRRDQDDRDPDQLALIFSTAIAVRTLMPESREGAFAALATGRNWLRTENCSLCDPHFGLPFGRSPNFAGADRLL